MPPPRNPGPSTTARHRVLTVTWAVMLLSVLPWRVETYFTGGIDPVVIAKSVMGGAVLVVAWFSWGAVSSRRDTGLRTTILVAAYLAVSVLGGWAADALVPSAVLAIRTGLLLATMLLIIGGHTMREVVLAARDGTTGVGVVVALSGIGSIAVEGRLRGGILPLNPNLLALMFGFVLVVHLWLGLERRTTRGDQLGFVVLLALLWLTGSRTGLLAALLAMALVALTYSRRPGWLFLVAASTPALGLYLLTSTGLAEAYFNRGGGASVLTLNSRTIAWQAAFEQPYEFWQTLFGRGLSAKTVGVQGTFWDTQVLDSSWVSAYVQVGVIGLLLLAVWAAATVLSCLRMPHPDRALFFPLSVFALLWSVTASGLIDSFALFLLMLIPALAADQRPVVSDRTASERLPTGARRVRGA